MRTRWLLRPLAVTLMAVVLLGTSACAITGGTLGGREKCWDEAEKRAPSLWRGVLRIDANGDRLETPEGDVIPLVGGAVTMRPGDDGVGQLVHGSDVLARSGDNLTLFGGAGADGALVVCGVEEIHARG